MSVAFKFDGVEELIKELHALPAEIRAEGMAIVHDETEGASEEIRQHYPEESHTATGTGKLRAGVKTSYPADSMLVGTVTSRSPESHLYEFGTQVRHTAAGANRGAAPPHPVTVPIIRRRRAQMFDRLGGLLQSKGFEVRNA